MNPGTSEMHFVRGARRRARDARRAHLFEGVATGAADGYARITGRPAAALLHLGPGLGNGVANLHNARRARTPLVCIVGAHATYHDRFDPPLQSDIAALAGAVSGLGAHLGAPARGRDGRGARRGRRPAPARSRRSSCRRTSRGARARPPGRRGRSRPGRSRLHRRAGRAVGAVLRAGAGGPALGEDGLRAASRIAAATAPACSRRTSRPGWSAGPAAPTSRASRISPTRSPSSSRAHGPGAGRRAAACGLLRLPRPPRRPRPGRVRDARAGDARAGRVRGPLRRWPTRWRPASNRCSRPPAVTDAEGPVDAADPRRPPSPRRCRRTRSSWTRRSPPAATCRRHRGPPRHTLLTLTGGAIGDGVAGGHRRRDRRARRSGRVRGRPTGQRAVHDPGPVDAGPRTPRCDDCLVNNASYAILQGPARPGRRHRGGGGGPCAMLEPGRPGDRLLCRVERVGVPAVRVRTAEELVVRSTGQMPRPGPNWSRPYCPVRKEH